eukprot:2475438-Amphidinium_carterae.1
MCFPCVLDVLVLLTHKSKYLGRRVVQERHSSFINRLARKRKPSTWCSNGAEVRARRKLMTGGQHDPQAVEACRTK